MSRRRCQFSLCVRLAVPSRGLAFCDYSESVLQRVPSVGASRIFVRQEIGDHNESLPIVTMRELFSGTVTVTQTNEFIFIFIFIYFLLGRFRPALLPLFLVAALTCTRFTLTTSNKRGVAILHFTAVPTSVSDWTHEPFLPCSACLHFTPFCPHSPSRFAESLAWGPSRA